MGKSTAKPERDLAELLDELNDKTIEHAAIVQAAHDYVCLREVIKPFNVEQEHEHETSINLAYDNLKQLVY